MVGEGKKLLHVRKKKEKPLWKESFEQAVATSGFQILCFLRWTECLVPSSSIFFFAAAINTSYAYSIC